MTTTTTPPPAADGPQSGAVDAGGVDARLHLSRLSAHAPHFLSAQRVRDWTDQAQVHRAVMALFKVSLPGLPDQRRAESAILYRVDPSPRGSVVLVQSTIAPQSVEGLESIDATVLLDRIVPAERMSFRIKANVVRATSRSGKRVAVKGREEQVAWLEDRLAAGLRIDRVADQRVAVEHRARMHPIHTVLFQGEATVRDADAARALLIQGVGRSRAFGCGMLSLVPL
jgi:CRISPR system Cascade subunit CasE